MHHYRILCLLVFGQALSPSKEAVAKNQRMEMQLRRGVGHVDAELVPKGVTVRAEVEGRRRRWASRRAMVGGDFDSLEEESIVPLQRQDARRRRYEV